MRSERRATTEFAERRVTTEPSSERRASRAPSDDRAERRAARSPSSERRGRRATSDKRAELLATSDGESVASLMIFCRASVHPIPRAFVEASSDGFRKSKRELLEVKTSNLTARFFGFGVSRACRCMNLPEGGVPAHGHKKCSTQQKHT